MTAKAVSSSCARVGATSNPLLAALGAVALHLVAAVNVVSAAVVWPADQGGNNHLYDLVTNEVTWAHARLAALATKAPQVGYGPGYLVTITSSEEQAFIAAHFPPLSTCAPFQSPCIWTGARDDLTEGTWMWVNGPEAFNTFYPAGGYSNWAPGEPNNYVTEEDCAIYGWQYTTKWNDIPCESSSYYLIEWDPFRSCGDPIGPDNGPIGASDALYILRVAVGIKTCLPCTCDVDGNKEVTATDALRTLRRAVGQNVAMKCPVCGGD